ncbi:putative apolipoprotein O-like [Scophthalmus maximus]|uniref:MICOS complex subunit n=1 Tax=Scophthalmus maximus TaxID=52904 RepID=A0A2U9BII3_SCOMX|nr:MICOS complex subunit MIC26-like [Scophthalmus maximus]AWP03649.1 putative apolipoprotein O-like [Scophthalmus maximus]KAF0046698.1 hypothetical protein F2P81_000331 [Scophthalmus maximus]
MLKVTGSVVMPAALGLLPTTVHAAAGDGENEATGPLHRDELSLYTGPPPPSRVVEPEAGQLEQRVAALRQQLEPYAACYRAAYGEIKPKVQRVVRSGTEALAFLRNPPKDFYPRAAVIGFTGALGLLLARGSRVKRLVYPGGLVAVSASLYYPERAAAVARSAGDSVYERVVRGYAAVERMVRPETSSRDGGKVTDGDTRP